MELSPEGIAAYLAEYIRSMPSEILRGDIFALTITLIAFFIAVVIINRLTTLLILVLKKIILFVIVALAFWQFISLFFARLSTEGLTNDLMIFGAAGIIVGFVAVVISLYVAFLTVHAAREEHALPTPAWEGPGTVPGSPPLEHGSAGIDTTTRAMEHTPFRHVSGGTAGSTVDGTLSINSLKSDRSLGAVLAYLIIAQFGVFSSVTIPAPTFIVGVAFFTLFLVAALFFIHFTYSDYRTGIRHLALAVLVGALVAVILGYFWADIPFATLLSPAFFESNALVALVTGLAISLFMGGKG